MCIVCSQGFTPGSSLFHATDSDATASDYLDPASASKPVFSDTQIILQLKTQWGGSYEGKTRSWSGSTVYYSIPDSGSTFKTPEAAYWVPMTAKMEATARYAFEMWDELIAINLTEGTATNSIRFGYADKTSGSGGYVDNGGTYALTSIYAPDASGHSSIVYSDIWINNDWWSHDEDSDLYWGSYGIETYLHEIGHSLGLSHAGSYNGGGSYDYSAEFAQDTHAYTLMSYFRADADGSGTDHYGSDDQWYYPQTPMLYDIAAIQSIYGTDTKTRVGDTVYGFNSTAGLEVFNFSLNYNPVLAFWDAGGNDTLDVSGYSTTQTINLTPGTFSSIGYMTNNVAIAFGATIENAIGGSGADTVIGNSAWNRLDGGAGSDTLMLTGAVGDYSFIGTALDFSLISMLGGTDQILNFEYVKVGSGAQISVGSFLSVIATDDFADRNTDTSGPIGTLAVGGPATGTIETSWDVDVFAINLTAGQQYTFTLASAAGVRSLINSTLYLISSGGFPLISKSSPGTGLSTVLTYTATVTGKFFLEVSGVGANDFGAYTLSVASGNTPPAITSGGGATEAWVTVAENSLLATTVTATDAEGTSPTFSIVGGADAVKFTINAATGAVSFKAAPNYEAAADADGDNVYDIVVQASDGIATDTQTIHLTVENRAEAPVATSVNLGAITEDSSRLITASELKLSVTDSDGDPIVITSLTLTSGKGQLINNGNGTWTFTPAANDDTSVTFSYTASDGTLTASSTATLDLTPVNDAPIVAIAIPDKSVAEETAWSFSVPAGTFTDAESATLTYSAGLANGGALPSWLTFNASTRTFSGTPPKDFTGSIDLKVTASDGSLTVSDSFLLTVTNVDDAPVVAVAIPDRSVAEETAWSYQIPAGTFTDVDNASLTLSATLSTGAALPAWLWFDPASGTFSGTPPKDFFGTVTLKVTASDGALSVSDTFVLTVTNVADAPVVAVAIPDRSVNEDSAWSYQVPAGTFTDPDGSTLTYSASLADGSSLPAWLTFSTGTRTFSGTPPKDFNGTIGLKVTASDGTFSTSDTFVLTVNPVNDAPVASGTGNAASGAEDTVISGKVPAGSDVDSTGLTYELAAAVTGLVFNTDGSFSYTPAANFNGTTTFQYRIVDPSGAKSSAQTFTLTVTGVNDAPTAVPVNLGTLAEDGVLTITAAQLRAGVTDADGTIPTITSFTLTSGKGQLVANTDGTWTYTAAPNDDTMVSFSYTATDGVASVTSSATLDLTAVNDPPVANPDSATASEGGGVMIDVLANDVDADNGDTLTLLSVDTSTAQGIANILNGKILYSTHAGFQELREGEIGTDTFTYTVTDSAGAIRTGTVTVTVIGTNDAPLIYMPIQATIQEGAGPTLVNLLQNVHDPDAGETASLKVIGLGDLPEGVSLSADGQSVVVDGSSPVFDGLAAGQSRSIEITYQVEDVYGARVDHKAVMTIVGTNDAPTAAIPAALVIAEDSASGVIAINAADLDGDNLTYALKSGFEPSKGSVSFENGSFVYTAHRDAEGADSFVIVVNDDHGGTVEQAVNVTITASNDAPVADNLDGGWVMASAGASSSVVLPGWDPDLDDSGDTLIYRIIDGLPAGLGSVTITDGRTLTFTVGEDLVGFADGETQNIQITYKTTDRHGVDSDIGTVTFHVAGVNDAPVAQDVVLWATVSEDAGVISGVFNADDADADDDAASLTYSLVSPPPQGSVTLGSAGSFEFSAGADFEDLAEGEERQVTFSYSAQDRHGMSSGIKTVTVTVVGKNDAPTVSGEIDVTGVEGDGSLTVDLLQGATDIDGDEATSLRVVGLGALPDGLSLAADGRTLVVDTNSAAFDSLVSKLTKVLELTYKVADSHGAEVSRTAIVRIEGTNDAPRAAVGRTITINEDMPVVGIPIGSTDPDGDTMHYRLKDGSRPHKGSVFLQDGTFTYTPAANANGDDSFEIIVSDGYGASVEQRIDVVIKPVNDAPTVLDLNGYTVLEDAGAGTVVGRLSGFDLDTGDILSFSLVDDAGGRFAVQGNQLVVANGQLLDYETAGSHQIKLRATDTSGAFIEEAFLVFVSDAMETVTGTGGKNMLRGGFGADLLIGGRGNDVLVGEAGNDRLEGGLDNDRLYGGAGRDSFVFNTKLNAKTNVDKISDFSVADDTILLDNAIFKKVGAGTPSEPKGLNKAYFAVGPKAKDKNDYIVYDSKKGALYYDADGSGKGAAIQVATLSKNLKMTYLDFMVI